MQGTADTPKQRMPSGKGKQATTGSKGRDMPMKQPASPVTPKQQRYEHHHPEEKRRQGDGPLRKTNKESATTFEEEEKDDFQEEKHAEYTEDSKINEGDFNDEDNEYDILEEQEGDQMLWTEDPK